MELDFIINSKNTAIKLLSKDGNMVRIMVDDRLYDIDIVKVKENVYSIIHNGKSHNIEVVPGTEASDYTATTLYNSYQIKVFDAQTRYRLQQKGATNSDTDIKSPMPGKVVKIPVSEGQLVAEMETLIVVEAMKMQSEYKAPYPARVEKILVTENQTIDGNQILIKLKHLTE